MLLEYYFTRYQINKECIYACMHTHTHTDDTDDTDDSP